jgi:hypothetical protein
MKIKRHLETPWFVFKILMVIIVFSHRAGLQVILQTFTSGIFMVFLMNLFVEILLD